MECVGEPREAVSIGERNALMHFCFVSRGVKFVGVDKFPTEALSEQASDGGFAGAGDTHHHDDHSN